MNYYIEYTDTIKKYTAEGNSHALAEIIQQLLSESTHYSLSPLSYELAHLPFDNIDLFDDVNFKNEWLNYFSCKPFSSPQLPYFDMLHEYIHNQNPNAVKILNLFLSEQVYSTVFKPAMYMYNAAQENIYSIIDTAVCSDNDDILYCIADYMCRTQHNELFYSQFFFADALYIILSLYKRRLYTTMDKIFHTFHPQNIEAFTEYYPSYPWDFCEEMDTLSDIFNRYFPHTDNSLFIRLCFNRIQQIFTNTDKTPYLILDKLISMNVRTNCLNDIAYLLLYHTDPILKEKALSLLGDNPVLYLQELKHFNIDQLNSFKFTLKSINNLTINIDNKKNENEIYSYIPSTLFSVNFTKALLKSGRFTHTEPLADNIYIKTCLDYPKITERVFNALDMDENDFDTVINLCLEHKNMQALNIINNLYSQKHKQS